MYHVESDLIMRIFDPITETFSHSPYNHELEGTVQKMTGIQFHDFNKDGFEDIVILTANKSEVENRNFEENYLYVYLSK